MNCILKDRSLDVAAGLGPEIILLAEKYTTRKYKKEEVVDFLHTGTDDKTPLYFEYVAAIYARKLNKKDVLICGRFLHKLRSNSDSEIMPA